MKIFFSLLLLISFTSLAQAQEFAPVGAKWWYSQAEGWFNPFFESFTTIESIKDTEVVNQTGKKLIATYHHFLYDSQDTFYMYSEDRKMYYFSEDSLRFLQLYDFNKEVGDSFIVEGYYTTIGPIQPLKAYVDSVDTIEINSVLLKRIFTKTFSLADNLYGWSIEGIGNYYWMFPVGDNFTIGPIRCYEDSILGLYETGIVPACDFVASVNEVIGSELFSIVPNPVHDFLSINFPGRNFQKPFSISIRNILGKLLLSKTFSAGENRVDVSTLAPGIYFLEIKSTQGSWVRKFEKQ